MEFLVSSETSKLRSVIIGIADSLGKTPVLHDLYDPKSIENLKKGTYPLESEMVNELQNFVNVLKKYGVDVYRPKVIEEYNQIFTRDIGFVIDNFFFKSNILPKRAKEFYGIESILSNFTKLSSIIFDEIDTGISGSVSSKVAELMKYMSDKMQVIVITHTPQVASKGDFHFKVYKREENNKVITDVKLLSDKERVNEIAEMLSGDKSNKSANELANELLN